MTSSGGFAHGRDPRRSVRNPGHHGSGPWHTISITIMNSPLRMIWGLHLRPFGVGRLRPPPIPPSPPGPPGRLVRLAPLARRAPRAPLSLSLFSKHTWWGFVLMVLDETYLAPFGSSL